MYPSLYYLLSDLLGINIPPLKIIHTFGFMVALAFLASAYTLYLEFKRKEAQGLLQGIPKKILVGKRATTYELVSNGFFGFIIGFKIIGAIFDFSSLQSSPHHYIFSLEGSWIGGLIAAVLMASLKYYEKEKEKLPKPEYQTHTFFPHQMVGDITIAAAIGGFIGAKLFHNLEYFDEFKADPIGGLLSFSGLTFYGGLIFGCLAVLYYANKQKISIKHILDSSAPGLMLAYGIGRIGCHLAGDGDWGISNLAAKPGWLSFLPDWMWAFDYPGNVISAGVQIPGCDGPYCYALAEAVFPTPFYESIICIGLFGLLWYLRKKITIPVVLFCVYLIFNGIERYFIQQIRIESIKPEAQYTIFGYDIAQAELIGVLLVVIGIGGIVYLVKKNRSKENGT